MKSKQIKQKGKKKAKRGFFRRNYKESWNYVKESRRFIYVSIAIFAFFMLWAFFVPAPPGLEATLLDFIENLLKQTQGLTQFGLIKYIFLNNIQSSFMGLFLGVLLGIYPVITSIVNGYLIGFVAARSVSSSGVLVLWKLLPHGIFELPALFISLGLGLKLGTFIFKKNKFKTFKNYIVMSLKVFIFVVMPLLLIAAIIEGSLIAILGGA